MESEFQKSTFKIHKHFSFIKENLLTLKKKKFENQRPNLSLGKSPQLNWNQLSYAILYKLWMWSQFPLPISEY